VGILIWPLCPDADSYSLINIERETFENEELKKSMDALHSYDPQPKFYYGHCSISEMRQNEQNEQNNKNIFKVLTHLGSLKLPKNYRDEILKKIFVITDLGKTMPKEIVSDTLKFNKFS
jgi:hypothetical protein